MGHNNPSYLLHITLFYTFGEKSDWRHLALQKAVEQQTHPKTGEEEGKKPTPIYNSSFLGMYLVIPIRQLCLSPIVSLAESSDEEGEYISEDWETETKRNRKTAQRVQMAILQDLRQSHGAAATLPEKATKDLILQVNLIPLSVMSTITIQTVISHSWYLSISFFLYRESVVYKWVAGCRRQPQNTNTRGSPEYM